jgi:uncharacterized protein
MDNKSDLARLNNTSLANPIVQEAVISYVDKVVSRFGELIISIILYGSQARGDAQPESDIDLLVVIQQDTPALRQALAEIAWQVQFDHNVVISDTIRSADQFQDMQTSRFPYYKTIEQEGIILWKNLSETTPAYA